MDGYYIAGTPNGVIPEIVLARTSIRKSKISEVVLLYF